MGLKAEFRPCIDLHDGKVKQIVGGTLDAGETSLRTNFVSQHEPEYFARMYAADKLYGGHVIRLGSGNTDAALQALAAWRGGLQLGGGINDENAAQFIEAGAAKVIVTSFVFSDGIFKEEKVRSLVRSVGADKLVLDLSCRKSTDGKYYVVTDRWQKFTSLEVNGATFDMLAKYCSEFLVHAVDVEGHQAGIDEELLDILADNSPLPCVYAGGIRSFSDIEKIENAGRGRVHYTIGSALDIFGGKLSYRKVVEYAKNSLM